MTFVGRIRAFDGSVDGGQRLAVIAILLVLGGLCLLVPILIQQMLSEGRKQAEYYQALQQSVETRTEVRRVFAALQDAEAAQRGFLLTGRQEFLDGYEQATRRLPDQINAFEVRANGTSPAVRLIVKLVPATMQELRRGITSYQQNGPTAAAEIVANGRANRYMDQIRAAIDETLSTESQNIEQLSAEVRDQAASSQWIILALFGAIILTVLLAGAAGLVYFAHRRRAERDLRDAWQAAEAAQQDAEAANRAKTEFLATMSHEIRTPLHSVIGSTELLLEKDELELEQREYVERIQVSGTVLLNLVNDVLDLAKIEAGEVKIIAEPFSLETLIDNSISIVRTTALRKGLTLRVMLDHQLPVKLLGDEFRLRQILLNLLGNAIKFTDQGEVILRVEHLSSSETGETLGFSVIDTGVGIPEGKRERLFQRFSQISESARRGGGTGLGLAISKQLVELMGGVMGFESEAGRGSTFWFSLSLQQVEADIPEPSEVEYARHEDSGRILVVDDLDQNRDLAQRMLEGAGYAVDLATDGNQAVAAVQTAGYDLVLMDIQMDGMDGITATRIIRNLDHPAKDVAIIAMTANVLADDVKLFKTSGMNDHLGKPFKRKQLLDKVRQWLRPTPVGQMLDAPGTVPDINSGLAFDQAAIDELCSAMGRAWVSRSLSELTDELDHTFTDIDVRRESVDRDALARQAHLLVARAGVFGFSELARLCSALELACRRGDALEPVLARVQPAALHVRVVSAQLLKKLSVHTS